jgi:hypothetical protein
LGDEQSTPPKNAGPSCAPSLNHFDRTEACWTDNLTILVYTEDGELVGEIHFVLIDSLHLRLTSRSFTENLTVHTVSPEGETPAPVSLDLRASCGSPCHATAHFAGVLRTGLSGTVSYDDSIGAGKSHSTRTKYVLDFSAPDFTELTPVVWNSPSQAYYRCDDMFSGQGAGCVFPNFAPTLTTMTNMKDIADLSDDDEVGDDKPIAATFALAERLTGVRITPDLLENARYACGIVRT